MGHFSNESFSRQSVMIYTEMALVFYSILPFVVTYASSAYIGGDWIIDTSLTGRYTAADQIFKKPAKAVSHCAALCQLKALCSSFFLNPTTSECFGNKNLFVDQGMTTAAINYVHYRKASCLINPPTIPLTEAAIDMTGQEPVFKYSCVANAVFISGGTVATCQSNTFTWAIPTIKCKDVSNCVQNGYTYDANTGSCFKFITNTMNYNQAQETCNLHGRVVRPNSAGKQRKIASLLSITSPNLCVWTDGNDKRLDGNYVWSNSAPITYFNWKKGEPSKARIAWGSDCIAMWPTHGYKWDDIRCSEMCCVLCERLP